MNTLRTSPRTTSFPMHALGRVQGSQSIQSFDFSWSVNQTIIRSNLKNSLRLSVPEWGFEYEAPIIQTEDSGSKLTVKTMLGAGTSMILHILGGWLDENFLIESTEVNFEQEIDSPQAGFVTATFASLFQIAPTIHDLFVTTTIDMPARKEPIPVISFMLQWRQLAYRLMVLERALGVNFLLTPDCTEQEWLEAAFVYRALTEQRFIAAFDMDKFFRLANEENSRTLLEWRQKRSIAFGYTSYAAELFGAKVSLGRFGVKIADALIENYAEAEQAMARQDGNPVPWVIRSLRGEAEWNFLDCPPLPPIIWEEKMQRLIDLDRKLSDAVADRYIALATATLEGLSEEQKIAVTTRPVLDPEAFAKYE